MFPTVWVSYEHSFVQLTIHLWKLKSNLLCLTLGQSTHILIWKTINNIVGDYRTTHHPSVTKYSCTRAPRHLSQRSSHDEIQTLCPFSFLQSHVQIHSTSAGWSIPKKSPEQKSRTLLSLLTTPSDLSCDPSEEVQPLCCEPLNYIIASVCHK